MTDPKLSPRPPMSAPPPSQGVVPPANPPMSAPSPKPAARRQNYAAKTLKVALTAASVAATLGGWALISSSAPEMKAEAQQANTSPVAQAQPAIVASPTVRPQATATPIGPARGNTQTAPQAAPTQQPAVRPQATAMPRPVQPAPQARPRTRSSR